MVSRAVAPGDYSAFSRFLEQACGIVLGDNKDYLVASRLDRVMDEFGISTLADLMVRIQGSDSALRTRVIDAMTTNETLWFRDAYPFEILKQSILPALPRTGFSQLQFWSAGCSTGEEPYSISMAIQEYQQSNPVGLPADVQILATDISSHVLAAANTGRYDEKSLARGISADRKQRFFVPDGGAWRVRDEIRRRVTFRSLNLKDSYAALGRFDVIFCRNVLIYFSADLKRDILQRMHGVLKPRGFLVLGASESVSGYSDDFEMIRGKPGVIYRRK